ncbi:hypothetical protein HAX54_015398 [Datura stramonium]|uniref:Uncharacterized protein n=1 Tax=Datura stramonium TaxID=4076 RepID=A0ABS8Y6C0_DATST|nr:hypothetical protein [Datura stramonium]
MENPEGSKRRADTRNDEQMAHLEQELEILREELRQVRDLTKLNVTTFPHSLRFPSFETPAPEHFPKSTHPPQIPLASSGLPSVTPPNLPNLVKQTPYVPNVKPNSPPMVKTAPNVSLPTQAGIMHVYPTMQHIPGANVATSYELHVPPVYAVEAPAFTTPVTVRVPYENETIKCTPAPPNVNNNPLPNYGNQGVNMITLHGEYGMRGTIMAVGNIEAVVAESSVAPFVTVQLRAPLTIQAYQPKSVVATLISKKLDYNSKEVSWDYQAEAKTKMISTAIAHGMTRSGRCYVPNNLNKPAPRRE